MTKEDQILTKLDRLLTLLSRQQKDEKKDTFVTGSMVKKMTGWSDKDLDKYRRQGLLKFKREGAQRLRYSVKSVEELKSKMVKK